MRCDYCGQEVTKTVRVRNGFDDVYFCVSCAKTDDEFGREVFDYLTKTPRQLIEEINR